jgi:hypothetical protein
MKSNQKRPIVLSGISDLTLLFICLTQARDLFLAAGGADNVNEQKDRLQQTRSQSQSGKLRLTQGQEGEEAAQEDQPELLGRTAKPEWARTQPYEDGDEGAEGGWNHKKWVEEAVQKAMPGKARKPKGRASSSVIPTQQVYHLDRVLQTLARSQRCDVACNQRRAENWPPVR